MGHFFLHVQKKRYWAFLRKSFPGIGPGAIRDKHEAGILKMDPEMARNPYKPLQNDDFWSKRDPDED